MGWFVAAPAMLVALVAIINSNDISEKLHEAEFVLKRQDKEIAAKDQKIAEMSHWQPRDRRGRMTKS